MLAASGHRARTEAYSKQVAALAEPQKYVEMSAISQQMEKLGEERQLLNDSSEQQATANAIGAAVSRDTTAPFTLVVGDASRRTLVPFDTQAGNRHRYTPRHSQPIPHESCRLRHRHGRVRRTS